MMIPLRLDLPHRYASVLCLLASSLIYGIIAYLLPLRSLSIGVPPKIALTASSCFSLIHAKTIKFRNHPA